MQTRGYGSYKRINSEGVTEKTVSTTYSNILIHIIFSTKDRKPLITDQYHQRLCAYIGGIIRNEGAILLALGGTADHLHILIKIKPTQAVSDLIRKIKANSSKWITDNHLCQHKFGWQNGYGGFSVSTSQIEKVRRYIENQVEHHQVKTFKEELIELLMKHGVDFDPKYLSD